MTATRIVLAGGGHANALALLQLAGVNAVTLISDGATTPYSGMLPGYIAGIYQSAQCFINLQKTAQRVGATFIPARVRGIAGNELLLTNGESIGFDVLSLNTGAEPLPTVQADTAEAVGRVKPIGAFMHWLNKQDRSEFNHLTVVGGGAGGVETVLALAHRWRHKTPAPKLTLVARRLLPHSTPAVRRYVQQQMAAQHIEWLVADVQSYRAGALQLADGGQFASARVVYATEVAAAPWWQNTGLALDESGFICVNSYLQAATTPPIFISGDAAAHPMPLAKAGVMAVRQGNLLAHNIKVAAGVSSAPYQRFSSNTQALYILGAGDGKHAVASRNGITVHGKWVWRWKQYLDFKFMHKFS
ncbi:MAG: FAD-dependent oxidoreductase [Proteobacteria bacterium]|nr:FAD-dependent oxidoreductase [Pseudomonadota bacterium]